MPKMKTHKAAAKRFKVTANGKVKYRRQGRNHILTNKSRKNKRQNRRPAYLNNTDAKRVKQILNQH